MRALRLAMNKFNLPLVKYLVRNGALRQGHTTADIRDFCELWAERFDHLDFNLAVFSFLFDTIVGEHLSEANVETIVEAAIGGCSVAQLRWLQQQGIHLDMALIRQRAISHHGLYNLDYRQKQKNFLQWLDTQASTAYGHYDMSSSHLRHGGKCCNSLYLTSTSDWML